MNQDEQNASVAKPPAIVPLEAEVEVAGQVAKLLAALDSQARCRIIEWVAKRVHAEIEQNLERLTRELRATEAHLAELRKEKEGARA